MKSVKENYFMQIFPFQPRCFDAVRAIVRNPDMENLASVRSAMHYIYDLVSDASLLSRNSLIRVCDLLRSRDLSQDINSAQKEAYTSYTAAMEGVTDLGLDEGDLAKDIITTLFLEYVGNKDGTFSPEELAEMTLVPSDYIKNVDNVKFVLNRLKDLPQIKYTKERAAFNVSEESDERAKELKSSEGIFQTLR